MVEDFHFSLLENGMSTVTMLWEPELETDAEGQARPKFKLADNITNWRLSVTASTLDGRIAKASSDIRAFQPFFVDHDPPVVTAGDRLDLPVTIRNYLDKVQPVTVEMQPNAWSEVEGPAKRDVRIEAGDSVNVTFPIHVTSADNTARQHVTATGAGDSDAIEKPVRIHPDGQETAQVTTDLLSSGAKLRLTIPAGAIAGATQGELRIYPNLLSTLRDAIEGLVQRPYGCAEQTTSAGYSNLIALRYARSAGYHNAAFEKHAIHNLKLARDRLAGYFALGGVSYWEHGSADLAVSAYVLRYLIDASAVIAVEPKRIENLATWLSKQSGNDGLWGAAPGVAGAMWSKTAAIVRGLVQRDGPTRRPLRLT
jgi:alpha-2-macroglobulin-like protein